MTSYSVNYGLPSPDGTDGVVVHSDIKDLAAKTDEVLKTTNDRVDAAEAEIDEARYYQGATPLPMPPERAPGAPWWDALDLLPTDVYTIWAGAVAERYGFPFNAQCDVTVHRWGVAGGTVKVQTREDPPRYFIGSRLSGGWGEGLIEVGSSSAAGSPGLSPATPAGYKSVGVDFTTGYGGEVISGAATTKVVHNCHALADQARVHIRNWNPRYENADRPAVTLSSVRMGRHTGGGAGADWVTLRTGSTEYVSQTISTPLSWRGQEVIVEYAWSGGEVTKTLGTGWTDGVSDNFPALFVWVEYRVPSTVPSAGVFGSSTGAGVGSARPMIDGWAARWARANGAIISTWANSGDSAAAWIDADRKYGRHAPGLAAPDVLFYAMLSNDLSAGTPLVELKELLVETVAGVRANITVPIYGTTITPRAPMLSNDADRLALNAYMVSSGLFQDVFDFSAAVSLSDGTLDPAVNADGTHVNDAGHERLKNAVNKPVVLPAKRYTVEQSAGRVVKVWDYLNNREQMIYGDTGLRQVSLGVSGMGFLRRVGQEVTLYLRDVITPTGSETIYTLPVGFTPDYSPQHGFIGRTGGRALAAFSITGSTVAQNGTQTTAMYAQLKFTTNDAWPTSLPGSAVGVIPNQ